MAMKPGDGVIWLYSPGRSFLSGWRLQEIPGVIVRVCRRSVSIRVCVEGKERLVNVDPENVIWKKETHDDGFQCGPPGGRSSAGLRLSWRTEASTSDASFQKAPLKGLGSP